MSDTIDTKIERFGECGHCGGSGKVRTLDAALDDIEDKLDKLNRNYEFVTYEYQKIMSWKAELPVMVAKIIHEAMKQGGGK